jgi:HD-GYP domain-containing protein (c-di-GMP phosphodiesterase class II)
MAIVVVLVLAIVLGVATVLIVRRNRAAVAAAVEQADEAVQAAREQFARERDMLRRQLARQNQLLARLQQSWRAEREWSRELRGQLAQQDRAHAALDGEGDDVRELVLKAAIELTESDRGLLLSREDADGDGDLDVVTAYGFRHDPRHSALAQRFARVVLERDQIIREDEPEVGGSDDPADDEISALAAIPMYLRDHFHGVVVCANRPGGYEAVDDAVLLALGDHASAALHHGGMRRELQDARRAAVRALVEAVAAREPLTQRESSRLIVYALHLARELEMDGHTRDVLVCAVLLRGIGNLALPDHVLHKPGWFTPEERMLVEVHPRVGFSVLGQAPMLREVATAVLYHHEHYDGGGYPAGLAGHQIPLTARALAVLEAFGAMIHDRPHRAAMTVEDACRELIDGSGSQFDPTIVQVFVEDIRRSPEPPSDGLAESVLEALPFDPAGAPGGLIGPLGGPSTDGLTLLGDHRAMHEGLRYAIDRAQPDGAVALAMAQLRDLERINAEGSFLVGDRVIQAAARNAQRAAVRLGGTAYRASGRRLAVLAPLSDDRSADDVRDELEGEFVGGPAVDLAVVRWQAGEPGDDLITRARRLL